MSYLWERSISFEKWSVHCTEDCIFIFYASLLKSVRIILLLVVPCKQISSHYIGTQRAIPGKGITEVLASLIRSSFCVRIVPLKPMTSTLRNGASTSNPILVHQPTLQYTRPSLTRTTGVVTIIYFCLLLHLLLLSRHRPGLTNIIYLSEGEDIFVFGSFQRLPRLFQSCNSKQIENEWVAIPAIRQNHGNGLTGRRTSHTRIHDGKEKSLGHIGLFRIVALRSQPGSTKMSLVFSIYSYFWHQLLSSLGNRANWLRWPGSYSYPVQTQDDYCWLLCLLPSTGLRPLPFNLRPCGRLPPGRHGSHFRGRGR